MFEVEAGVKGAMRITRKVFFTEDEAEAYAARVRRSNSAGDYWANVSLIKADAGDVRFEVVDILGETEDPQMATLVVTIDEHGAEVARDTFASYDDPYLMIEAAREAQCFSMEERDEMYAAKGW